MQRLAGRLGAIARRYAPSGCARSTCASTRLSPLGSSMVGLPSGHACIHMLLPDHTCGGSACIPTIISCLGTVPAPINPPLNLALPVTKRGLHTISSTWAPRRAQLTTEPMSDCEGTFAGEGAGVASLASDASNAFANAYLNVDIPLDGIGLISIPAAEIISPVFTLWITLVIMYIGMPSSQVSSLLSHSTCRASRAQPNTFLSFELLPV